MILLLVMKGQSRPYQPNKLTEFESDVNPVIVVITNYLSGNFILLAK